MERITYRFGGLATAHGIDHRFCRAEGDAVHRYYLLMYFKTPFLYGTEESPLRGEAGCYLLYPPVTPAYHASAEVGFVNDWLFFSGGDALISALDLPIGIPFSAGDGLITPYLARIEEERHGDLCHAEMISAYMTELLITLSRRYHHRESTPHPAYAAIAEARSHLLSHLDAQIPISHIAAEAGYSVSRFCILYRTFFGVTPALEVLRARLNRAAALLSYGGISVSEVAERCGFSSLHYFSRRFKEKYGVPPSRYPR